MPIRSVRKKQIGDTWYAPRGTPVYSAAEEYGWRIGENSLGGKPISILGAGGRIFYYEHLDHYAKDLNIGDFITPETVIGFVGTTGNAKGTPPHLHFGGYDSAGAIDPLTLLAELDDL